MNEENEKINIGFLRKVIRAGYTLAITIPKEYVDYYGIERGDELIIKILQIKKNQKYSKISNKNEKVEITKKENEETKKIENTESKENLFDGLEN